MGQMTREPKTTRTGVFGNVGKAATSEAGTSITDIPSATSFDKIVAMRGREFLMKDAYSFDLDQNSARHSYNKMFVAYLRTLARLGLKSIPMRAESGPIGGDLSHEFIILASTGESEVFCHKDTLDLPVPAADVNFDDIAGLQGIVDKWTAQYAATSDMHDAAAYAKVPADKQVSARGIEVGHIFYFGTKYSEPMKAVVGTGEGGEVPVHRSEERRVGKECRSR